MRIDFDAMKTIIFLFLSLFLIDLLSPIHHVAIHNV
jgi:hypothetical protein